MNKINILLADDHTVVRQGLKALLEAQPDMVVVGAVDDAASFKRDVCADFDVVVVGAAAVDQLDHCRGLLSTTPEVKVLAVSDNASEATFYELEPATHPLGEVSPGVDTGIRLTTENAEAEHAALRARDVDVDPEVLRFGAGIPAMFTFRDPDGNKLYVVETA